MMSSRYLCHPPLVAPLHHGTNTFHIIKLILSHTFALLHEDFTKSCHRAEVMA